MAKKNLSALMSGIMGQPAPEEKSLPSYEHSRMSEAQKDTAAAERSEVSGKRRGRPRNERGGERATFIVDSELLKKIKFISLVDERMQKDVVDEALRRYITWWESQNGIIKFSSK